MDGFAKTESNIVEVAEEVTLLEGSERFWGLSQIELGDTITDHGVRAFFGAVDQTQTVRNFTIRDAHLHPPSMLLFRDDKKLLETRYLVPDEDYEAARVCSAVPVIGGQPIIIGFNREWRGYYHWVVQCLPAIDSAMHQGVNSGARIALPKLHGWHADLLDFLGYGELDRLEIDRDICYALPRAIYSEHLNGSTAFGISRTALQTFQRLHKRARVPPSYHDAIYIARTDSSRRPMRNEEALIRFLETEGVTIVEPGTLSTAAQIGLFSGTKIVIGAHGGGLTNIVFCSNDAIIYELLPSHYPNACFNRLAQAKGVDYWADMFASDGRGDEHHQSWKVDLELVKRRFAAIRQATRPYIPVTAQNRTALVNAPAPGELFAYYATSNHNRPIHKWHHYFEIYEEYLARFRHVAPTVLELGVEQGGALGMWRTYFGPTCRLFGIDSNPSAKQYEDVATKIFIGDQRDHEFLRTILHEIGRPDVVINDGAHTASQQVAAFKGLYLSLSEDGIYLVEDTHTSLWGGGFLDAQDEPSFLDFAFQCCSELMVWTGDLANFEILGTDRNVTLWDKASPFCRFTKEISFFDSMIVFERGVRKVPRHEQR